MKCRAKTKTGKKCKNKARISSQFCSKHSKVEKSYQPEQLNLLFTNGLYYPFIEIPSEDWLKTALLYWETLSTIVPRSIQPYRGGNAKFLLDAGVLQPLFVEPDMPELSEIADDAISYLYTDEGKNALVGRVKNRVAIHKQKMSRQLLDEMGPYVHIHKNKFFRGLLRDLPRSFGRGGKDPWVQVPSAFGFYYMTLLATRLSASRGLALLTDEPTLESLANKASLGQGVIISDQIEYPNEVG